MEWFRSTGLSKERKKKLCHWQKDLRETKSQRYACSVIFSSNSVGERDWKLSSKQYFQEGKSSYLTDHKFLRFPMTFHRVTTLKKKKKKRFYSHKVPRSFQQLTPGQVYVDLLIPISSKEETGARKHLFTDFETTYSDSLKTHLVNHMFGESTGNTPFHKLQKTNKGKMQS